MLGSHARPAPPLKRQRSSSLDSEDTLQQDDAFALLGAEVLRSLKRGQWLSRSEQVASTSSCSAEELQEAASASSCDSVVCSAPKQSKQLSATSPKSHSTTTTTRSYVWRGPSRKASAPAPAACSGSSDPDSDHDDDQAAGKSDRDKDWAALTTWLRMNLHHPRTTKRQVPFVGTQDPESRHWHFELNRALCWDDLSAETKLRLQTLPQETEAAFVRKYPSKPPGDWVHKTQKYRPPGCSSTFLVPLRDMIQSLSKICHQQL